MNLNELSLFYNHFAVMQNSGISPVAFFEILKKSAKDVDKKLKINSVLASLNQGLSLTRSLEKSGLVPVFDLAVIKAGEHSGNLANIFQTLSKSYEKSALAEKTIKKGLQAPFFMFAFALATMSIPKLFSGDISLLTYILRIVISLGVVFGIYLYTSSLFMKSYYDLELAKTRNKFFKRIPVLKNLSISMALQKFCSSLALMLNAGIPIYDALKLAGRTSADDSIELASRKIIAQVKSGKKIGDAFAEEYAFTDDIKASVSLGHESGEIPAFLEQSATRLQTEINIDIERLSRIIPLIINWIVMLYISYSIIRNYVGNLSAVNDVLK